MLPWETFDRGIAASFARLLHFGISYGDLTAVTRETTSDLDWARSLAKRACRYKRIADSAWRSHHVASAIEGWRRATDYYHFAEFKLAGAPSYRRALQAQSRAAYRRLAPHLDPPSLPVEIPLTDTVAAPAYLRSAGTRAPCVLLVNGLDSAKEVELDYFADVFVRRGLTTVSFDGPGQGELADKLPLFAFDRAVKSVLDYLEKSPAIAPASFGVFGVSFGGHLACRAAALDERITACVSLGGFYDGSALDRLPKGAQANLLRACHLPEGTEPGAAARSFSLAPLEGLMHCPLLVVHGQEDHLVGRNQVEALRRWASGNVLVWVMAGAEHVCTNRFPECLPGIGDWLAGVLTHEFEPSIPGPQPAVVG